MAIEQSSGTEVTAAKAKWIRVKVVDHTKTGDPAINVNMPIGLVKFGMKMGQAFSPEMREAKVDWDQVAAMIEAGDIGQLVHVEDEAEHKTIDVWVE